MEAVFKDHDIGASRDSPRQLDGQSVGLTARVQQDYLGQAGRQQGLEPGLELVLPPRAPAVDGAAVPVESGVQVGVLEGLQDPGVGMAEVSHGPGTVQESDSLVVEDILSRAPHYVNSPPLPPEREDVGVVAQETLLLLTTPQKSILPRLRGHDCINISLVLCPVSALDQLGLVREGGGEIARSGGQE